MKPTKEDSDTILEFECHLDFQADSPNHVYNKWRMKIQNEQNKPGHESDKYCSGIYSIIHNINIRCYNSLHRKNSNAWGMNSNIPSRYDCI